MSVWIFIGLAIGRWALLSVISGECLRQQQAIEAGRDAREKAVHAGESHAG